MKNNMVIRGSVRNLLLFSFLISFHQNTHAINLIAKAAIGNKSSELIILDKSFTPDFTTLDLSLTGTHGRFFPTINNENSIILSLLMKFNAPKLTLQEITIIHE